MPSNGPVPDSVTASGVKALFNANWGPHNDVSVPVVTGVSCGGATFVCKQAVPLSAVAVASTINVSANFTTSFLGIIGQSQIKLSVTANASDNIPVYMTFYLLLDNTPSMGIASTTAGIQTMVNNTPDQCAFACHDLSNNNNYYNLAHQLGVVTRINNVALAAKNLLQTAQSTETSNGIPNEFSVAIYDFGAAASDPTASSYTGFTQVYPSQLGATSTDLSSAGSAAAAIDLMTVPNSSAYNDEDTSLNDPLNFAAANLTSSGTGLSSSSSQPVIFFVSDGVTDDCNSAVANTGDGTCRSIVPVDTTACTTLKNNGVKVAVLYTTYLPLPTNPYWQQHIAQKLQSWFAPWTQPSPPNPAADTIANNMSSCASPGLYFEVNSNGDINAAMQALFEKVVASVKITG